MNEMRETPRNSGTPITDIIEPGDPITQLLPNRAERRMTAKKRRKQIEYLMQHVSASGRSMSRQVAFAGVRR